MELTRGGVRAALEKLDRMKATAARIKEKSEEAVTTGFMVIEVAGSAAAWGYANTKYGKGANVKIAGFDGDLLTGIGLVGASMFGVGGKHAEHLAFLGAGSLASFGNRWGAQKAAQSMQQVGTGYAPAGAFGTGYAPAGAYATGYAPAGAYAGQ